MYDALPISDAENNILKLDWRQSPTFAHDTDRERENARVQT